MKILEEEIEKLTKSGFSKDYPEGFKKRVSLEDTIGIFQWFIQLLSKQKELEKKVEGQPISLRFQAYKPNKTDTSAIEVQTEVKTESYNFPFTTYITYDHRGNTYIEFDPNSKLARKAGDPTAKKDPPPKLGGKPEKFIDRGGFKVVRKTWSFNLTTGQIESSAALVCKGNKAIRALKKEFSLYQSENPLIWPIRGFIKYSGHDPEVKDKQPKAIAFAKRADGDLFAFLTNISTHKPDLGDMLWMCYSMIKGVALFNAAGRLHRDISPQNFLFVHNEYGFCNYLNDFGLSITEEQAKDEPNSFEGRPTFTPFDHPAYKPVIELHNQLIHEALESKDLDEEKMQPAYISRMEERIKNFALVLPGRYARPATHDYAISIILMRKSPSLPVSSYNHPNAETWALCLTLKRFFEKITIDINLPIILFLIEKVKFNLTAGYSTRMSIGKLLEEVEKKFTESINETTAQQPHFAKFIAQLRYHKISIPRLTVTNSETEEKTKTTDTPVRKNSGSKLFDQSSSTSAPTSSTIGTKQTVDFG